MKNITMKLVGQLIVSCQAAPGTPFGNEASIAAMALCAAKGGAGGLRVCWGDNIRAVKAATDLPVIGIHKRLSKGPMRPDKVYITPDLEAAADAMDAGADVLGMDFTPRGRSWRDIEALLAAVRARWPDIAVMADISTLEEGKAAAAMGVDIVSTTLSGYTLDSLRQMDIDYAALVKQYLKTGEIPEYEPDLALIADLKAAVDIPINAEGRIWERGQMLAAFNAGAAMVTVGSAITAPDAITKHFAEALRQHGQGK